MSPGAMKVLMAMAVVAASLWFPASSQSGCTTALIGLAPCLSYISGNSSTPSSTCCSQLAMVVQSQPQCLCTVLNGGASSLGITINQTQALALPGACKVQTPPVSNCKGGAPAAAPPASSQSPATPTAPTNPTTPSSPSNGPATQDVPSGNGSKSTNGNSSDGGRSGSPMAGIFSAVIFSFCISFLF